ncbi:MarR family winged helix-turn-helix transcriptional regulator [Natribacillus halophilus]|uniref:DNA-binding transcriptional regulator, MarR family n=1 Tax=Natribacillus halophilus TaxID=549003 RepID=A0A1G8JHW2_9BACI|nr:MarR family transcriptional regulator [Natribacillus halophilus]SDI30818.1 DNA-binding transcriptional regulator, MarR family [Natribacillus halophilus]
MHEPQLIFQEIVDMMKRIERKLIEQQQIPTFDSISLTKRQESILMYIFSNENVTMSDIASYFDISRSAVSQTLNKLEEQDIIVRSINQENRRELDLSLGENGEKLHQEYKKVEEMIVQNYFSKIETEDLRQIRDTIRKLQGMIVEEEHQ